VLVHHHGRGSPIHYDPPAVDGAAGELVPKSHRPGGGVDHDDDDNGLSHHDDYSSDHFDNPLDDHDDRPHYNDDPPHHHDDPAFDDNNSPDHDDHSRHHDNDADHHHFVDHYDNRTDDNYLDDNYLDDDHHNDHHDVVHHGCRPLSLRVSESSRQRIGWFLSSRAR